MNEKLCPVLLGADLNCYHVARAFHEAYGVVSHAFGRYPIGVTVNTRIVDFTTVEHLDQEDVMVETLTAFAKKDPSLTYLLIGCTDGYVESIARCADRLAPYYKMPYDSIEKIERLTSKENFYQLCDTYQIPYPKTKIVHKDEAASFVSPFPYPIILKPSVSASYWTHPFDGMKKVYRASDEAEARTILSAIFGAGYPDNVIVQDTIPGTDSAMYVLTAYCDRDAKVRMMCLGHVLLEEHTPKGLGNHAAILTTSNPSLCEPFRRFLEGEHFVGFANFDIKYDSRDGSFRAFEINTRQGRSNYYVTAAGFNIAKLIVEDRVSETEWKGAPALSTKEIYWRYIPDSLVKEYVSPELYQKVKELKKAGNAYSSFRYAPDLKNNLRRRFYILAHETRHIQKFHRYYHPEKQG